MAARAFCRSKAVAKCTVSVPGAHVFHTKPAARFILGHAMIALLVLNFAPNGTKLKAVPSYNVHDAKTHFSKLLDHVLEGEEVLNFDHPQRCARGRVGARQHGFLLGAGPQEGTADRTRAASSGLVGPLYHPHCGRSVADAGGHLDQVDALPEWRRDPLRSDAGRSGARRELRTGQPGRRARPLRCAGTRCARVMRFFRSAGRTMFATSDGQRLGARAPASVA